MKMLQKLVVFAFVISCIIGSVTHMNATANDETKIKLMAEKNFNYYIPSVRSNKDEFYLESDLVKVDFMVVGMQYNSKGLFGYWITPVNQMAGGLGVMYPDTVRTMLHKTDLQVGDLLSVGGTVSCAAIHPTYYNFENAKMEYLGYGPDVLGEEFNQVIRRQLVLSPEGDEIQKDEIKSKHTLCGVPLKIGDTDASGEVSVLDCIKLTKYLHGEGMIMICDYSWIVSDINQDGEIDVFDLGLLKNMLIK